MCLYSSSSAIEVCESRRYESPRSWGLDDDGGERRLLLVFISIGMGAGGSGGGAKGPVGCDGLDLVDRGRSNEDGLDVCLEGGFDGDLDDGPEGGRE